MNRLRQMPQVVRLDLAVVVLPDTHPAAGPDRRVPVYGYAILHPDGPILVDTGVGFGNGFIDELYRPERVVLDEELLERAGVGTERVAAVVNSHLHFDHCGQNPAFFGGQTPFYVQAAEYDAVERDRYYTDPTWALPPEPQRRTVRGDEQIADGVTVMATPGHTAGHQSVVVKADDRCVVVGAQVIWHVHEFLTEMASAANVDDDQALRAAAVESIRRVKALGPEVVHFSHCQALHLRPDRTG